MRPNTKVTVGLLSGAVVTVLVWLITATTNVVIPPEVAAAATMIVSFILSYMVPEKEAYYGPRQRPRPPVSRRTGEDD